jgi:hypothetical protein
MTIVTGLSMIKAINQLYIPTLVDMEDFEETIIVGSGVAAFGISVDFTNNAKVHTWVPLP